MELPAAAAGLGALEYGALTGIETDIYLAAVWVRASMAMQQMAEAVKDKTLDRTAAQHYLLAKKAFEEKFWDKDSQFYVYAKGWGEMIRKVYEVDPLLCPACGGQISIFAFIEDHKVIDKIIAHLKLTFMAERPPPPQSVQQELLMAAEERRDYF